MKHNYSGILKKLKPKGIQSTIMVIFSGISLSLLLVSGLILYSRFSTVFRKEMVQSTKTLMEQTGESLEDYLVKMRQISDTLYYNVIKENDFSSETKEIQQKMNLLYAANDENLQSIAIYNRYGRLMAAEPVAEEKKDLDVMKQDWYRQAAEKQENMHFSNPHVQNLFDDGSFRYYWVISLSRAIEITDHGRSQEGVLLVDMDYSVISRMMRQINDSSGGQYFYLCDSNGEIIYHPKQIQIGDGVQKENHQAVADYKEGIYQEKFEGENRKVIVNTISYTGWKLVGVLPDSTFTDGIIDIRYFVAMLMLLVAMMLVTINRVVSVRISRPILQLSDSVREYETGKKPEIYIGGSTEIRYLGHSIQSFYEKIDILMKEIVWEQTERRKSELAALQSQINPHFLYNTLESITWMIEGERNEEASFMITQLAKFFRISLSKGRTVITIRDELQHAQSYMNIQKIRYKNTFSVTFAVAEELYSYCTVKLILQPLLENAIAYGVGAMDDSGEIVVAGERKGRDIILSVKDNGIGMTEEEVEHILTDGERISKHGSGVGLVNVNNRIQILFGKEYGLKVESEPDEGTVVSIRMPAVPYTEENREILEKGHLFRKEDVMDEEV